MRHLRNDVEGKTLTMTVNMDSKTLALIIDDEPAVETKTMDFPVRHAPRSSRPRGWWTSLHRSPLRSRVVIAAALSSPLRCHRRRVVIAAALSSPPRCHRRCVVIAAALSSPPLPPPPLRKFPPGSWA